MNEKLKIRLYIIIFIVLFILALLIVLMRWFYIPYSSKVIERALEHNMTALDNQNKTLSYDVSDRIKPRLKMISNIPAAVFGTASTTMYNRKSKRKGSKKPSMQRRASV